MFQKKCKQFWCVITIVSFSTTILQKNECSSFTHESHAKMKFLNGENKENTQMLVFIKEHTNHFPRMVVLFLGWKPLGQRSSRFELFKDFPFLKAINYCVTPLSFYKYNFLTIANIVIIIEGQEKINLIRFSSSILASMCGFCIKNWATFNLLHFFNPCLATHKIDIMFFFICGLPIEFTRGLSVKHMKKNVLLLRTCGNLRNKLRTW